ncbi:DNA polymerase III subunit delta' [Oceanospirillum sediminis]|uniref:DNA polymerase III subunit delta' n=1 Tax=Oceanospirillum sediminis TaxID=2760088 RepID=A0A839ISQ4_9GAMM|nr:DNA polymerase III subunit delta' [Oceanospirillum sediminis]MBB1487467.1 DNA polymerase III subunit delta' [Oceanospirillum sediminis]
MTESQSSSLVTEPLLWQQQEWKRLIERYQAGRLPHALLISGGEGIGKSHLAHALTAYLLCRTPSDTACGDCASCQLLAAGSHPDLAEISPESAGKQIRIEQIRALQSYVGKTAQQGGFRVVIMQPADAMNQNSANALLKNLEEPGENVLFVLLTHRISSVLPTIRSRCQQIALPVPQHDLAVQWLHDNLESHQALHTEKLLKMANGNPLMARQLASDSMHEQRDKLFLLMESLTRGAEPVELAPSFQEGDLQWTLRWMQQWLADWSSWCLLQQDSEVRFPEMMPLYRHWHKTASLDAARELYQRVGELRSQLASGGNPNIQLAIEALLINWSGKMLV